jgi:hypothetical protein
MTVEEKKQYINNLNNSNQSPSLVNWEKNNKKQYKYKRINLKSCRVTNFQTILQTTKNNIDVTMLVISLRKLFNINFVAELLNTNPDYIRYIITRYNQDNRK